MIFYVFVVLIAATAGFLLCALFASSSHADLIAENAQLRRQLELNTLTRQARR